MCVCKTSIFLAAKIFQDVDNRDAAQTESPKSNDTAQPFRAENMNLGAIHSSGVSFNFLVNTVINPEC